MKLTDVSQTAIATLRCHVIESGKKDPLLHDPMAACCLERMMAGASEEEASGILSRRLSPTLTNHIAIRARYYDRCVNEYITRHPGCTVVNLGCGFDTRYWRIDRAHCRFIDLDLPEVIDVKKEILEGRLVYEMIGISVLDHSWVDRVTAYGNNHVLLLAEGLFMYLPKEEVIRLFRSFSERFKQSLVILEVVTDKYTRGLWKKIVTFKIKRELGLDAGSSYRFGIRHASELEDMAEGIRVVKEWSYAEDPDARPKIIRYLGLTRTQWTIVVSVNDESQTSWQKS